MITPIKGDTFAVRSSLYSILTVINKERSPKGNSTHNSTKFSYQVTRKLADNMNCITVFRSSYGEINKTINMCPIKNWIRNRLPTVLVVFDI